MLRITTSDGAVHYARPFSAPGVDVMKLADAIWAFNKPYANVIRGALIHQIPKATADQVAALMQASLPLFHSVLPDPLDALAYFCAVIGQESRFDPRAMNMNLPVVSGVWNVFGPGDVTARIEGYLTTKPLDRADLGISMFKVMFIRSVISPPVSDVDLARRYLFDPAWALPRMADRYVGLLQAAKTGYPDDDPKWTATGIYNAGARGFREAHADQGSAAWTRVKTHMDRVAQHYTWFRSNLDVV